MGLHELEIEHFRCLSKTKIDLSAQCNLIVGLNGSGKTSVLEAIYLLGCGHSFRTSLSKPLIQSLQREFLVVGKIRDFNGEMTVGIRGGIADKEYRVNGQAVKTIGELARLFPVQIIDPELHRLLEDGPSRRRKFIDWGVFHVEHLFFLTWQRFSRALKQRNAALKDRTGMMDAWNMEIVSQGVMIDIYRKRYLESLRPFLNEVGHRLLNATIDFEYQQGWRKSLDLSEALAENRQQDLLRCTTGVGPHRGDLVLKMGEFEVKDRISRGQQKLLACSLILAQQLHRAAIGAPPTCLLLDDPAAELDEDSLNKLLGIVSELPTQLIVTALPDGKLDIFRNAKKFHVEHGKLRVMA